MEQYDLIIIGGGIVGTSIARELSRYELNIALLEKEAELSFGVSKSNSGIIHPGTQMDPVSLKGQLCVMGNRLTGEIARELGVEFKRVGELIIAFTEADIEKLRFLLVQAKQLKVPKVKIVDRAWLRRNEPNLSHDACAALYAPSAGIISPYRMVYDLSENAVVNGVSIFTNATVKDITIHADKHSVRDRSVFDVITEKTVFTAPHVINAAGLYADAIARMLGIKNFSITPRKGEEYLLDKKRENITNHLIFPLPNENSKGILVIKTSDGNPMVGPTAVPVTDKEDRETTEKGKDEIFKAVQKMVPGIDQRDIIAYFAGSRPVAGDDFIIRCETAAPGLITVAGIQSPGLTAAPAIARMVVKLLRDEGLLLNKKNNFKRYRKKTFHLFSAPLDQAKELIEKDPDYGDIVCRCEMVSAKEIREAVHRGAHTLDGVKFRTRAQAGRCHGCFCTPRIMKIIAEETGIELTQVTKRGKGSEIVLGQRTNKGIGEDENA
jgi:glycerol-3-phosphate dehydrogenase